MLNKLWFVVIIYCLHLPATQAKARFMGLGELVSVSDTIAVIEVVKTKQLKYSHDTKLHKKGFWKYRQKKHIPI